MIGIMFMGGMIRTTQMITTEVYSAAWCAARKEGKAPEERKAIAYAARKRHLGLASFML